MRLKEAVEEVKKCVLICSNCHRELHAGLWNIDDLEE
jgi:predicted HNH restriction endonuclease